MKIKGEFQKMNIKHFTQRILNGKKEEIRRKQKRKRNRKKNLLISFKQQNTEYIVFIDLET